MDGLERSSIVSAPMSPSNRYRGMVMAQHKNRNRNKNRNKNKNRRNRRGKGAGAGAGAGVRQPLPFVDTDGVSGGAVSVLPDAIDMTSSLALALGLDEESAVFTPLAIGSRGITPPMHAFATSMSSPRATPR